MKEKRSKGWIPVALGATAIGLTLGVVAGLRPHTDDVGAGAAAAAPALPSISKGSTYSIYLVRSEEQAEEVQMWLIYGETMLVTPENEDQIMDILAYLRSFRTRPGGDLRVEVVDLR